ncbi:WecB/TagA/CpsF family glycosyltransferase [Methylomonas sp. EFPC1]|uniref:WecB/TagA/CpsF family glycosyltransferase n=1 Tax=Methylomonas sp. EFPC1 TaxID=2812647 RepID=UPI0019684A57|nr:WecB/TagA/CpsF family glycosyltransferase [Methylomonas sp. EFPC1]QSB01844.1 WecB/TagA/CpsF family glycosyltransferase [Methylomonas sp. EFPC1]
MPERPYNFGQLVINTGSLSYLDNYLRQFMINPARRYMLVGFLNPHVYNYVERDAYVRSFIQVCDLVCLDGVGITLAFRYLFAQTPPRVVATALFDRALAWPEPRVNAVLIGGTPTQAQLAADNINSRNGSWHIVAAYHGFMKSEEYRAILAQHADIDAVLVGAGTPKSEQILLNARDVCQRALCWHIGGGTLAVYAGHKARAPAWVSKLGIEWMHRFLHEPHYRSRIYPGAIEFAGHLFKNRFFTEQ